MPVRSSLKRRSTESVKTIRRWAADPPRYSMIRRRKAIEQHHEAQRKDLQPKQAQRNEACRGEAHSGPMMQVNWGSYDAVPEREQTIWSPPPSKDAERSKAPSDVKNTEERYGDIREGEEVVEIQQWSALRIVSLENSQDIDSSSAQSSIHYSATKTQSPILFTYCGPICRPSQIYRLSCWEICYWRETYKWGKCREPWRQSWFGDQQGCTAGAFEL